jgi:uncharacterized membrane protein
MTPQQAAAEVERRRKGDEMRKVRAQQDAERREAQRQVGCHRGGMMMMMIMIMIMILVRCLWW